MAVTRSFENIFEVTDYTQELLLVPNMWGLVNSMGLFDSVPVSQHSIVVESHEGSLAVITDRHRGERNNVNSDDTRITRAFNIPHFPLDDALFPEDIQGKRAYGSMDAAETEAAVMARKLERVRRNHAITMEVARCQAITQGTAYAPNGTVSHNYYTEFGITREEVDFVLGTATTEVNEKIEDVISHIQDNVKTGDVVSNIVVLCSPAFFAKLIKHAKITEAYKYYTSTQEPLRNRLGGGGLYRRFVHGGVEFVEYRGEYNGTALIPAGDAYAFPTGVADLFETYFSPARKFSFVNTLGEEAYAFTYRSPQDDKITIETEHNALHLVRRPSAVVRLYSSN